MLVKGKFSTSSFSFSICLCLCQLCLSVCLVCLSVCLSVCPSVRPFRPRLSVCLLCLCLCVSALSVSLSLSLLLSLSLSLSLSTLSLLSLSLFSLSPSLSHHGWSTPAEAGTQVGARPEQQLQLLLQVIKSVSIRTHFSPSAISLDVAAHVNKCTCLSASKCNYCTNQHDACLMAMCLQWQRAVQCGAMDLQVLA